MTSAKGLLDSRARLVIGHRGNSVSAAENTMNALEQAVQVGADAIEFDVRMTRDGVPVVLHDASLDRTTNGSGRLDAYSFDEVRAFDAGVRFRGGSRTPIPALEEVLDRFREIPLVIEVKEVAAVEATERMVRRFAAEDRVLLGSADASVSERLYRSGLRTCASMRDAAVLIPMALAGLTPSSPRYQVLSIPPVYHGVPIPVLRMAAAMHRAGLPTHVWTVNDPARARALWDGGVSGIVTDDPAAILRARSQ